ncbi:MAG TPA: hypothetical protein VFP89_04430 [Propionibacteriaceae bacterium]|nr:hypothetical protein [Propionibacteriaceae bacterium]
MTDIATGSTEVRTVGNKAARHVFCALVDPGGANAPAAGSKQLAEGDNQRFRGADLCKA